MSETFWNTSAQTPAVPVLDHDTPGDAATNPITIIRGADGTADGSVLAAEAEALFPTWDAVGNLISSRPASYSEFVTGEQFATWHSAHQLAWIAEFGQTATAVDDLGNHTFRYASFGGASNEAANLHFILSADGKRLITLNYLQRHDLAMLPLADQQAVAAHPAYQSTFAALYNMTPRGGQTIADARADAKTSITEAMTAIEASDSYNILSDGEFADNADIRVDEWPHLFREQLLMLSDELDQMAVFDADSVELRVADIITRFERVERVSDITDEVAVTGARLTAAVNAVDGGATIGSAFDTLVNIEVQLYDIAISRLEVIRDGTYQGQVLDTPGMVFVLQTLANYAREAEAEAETEDLNQRNALMEDYELMQLLINETLTEFSAAESGSTATETLALGNKPLGEFTDAELRTISMFDSNWSSQNGNTYHPYESEKGIIRPTESMFAYTSEASNAYAKEVWDTLGLNLSEATGTLGRDNQQVMDSINELNSSKNRHYDLASGTLNKMTEMLRSIIN